MRKQADQRQGRGRPCARLRHSGQCKIDILAVPVEGADESEIKIRVDGPAANSRVRGRRAGGDDVLVSTGSRAEIDELESLARVERIVAGKREIDELESLARVERI